MAITTGTGTGAGNSSVSQNFSNAYTSFSGVDITATFDNVPIGTLQGISYSVTREKSPVYTIGYANPRSFSRGKRGIAGSMIFTLFDRSALYQIVYDQNHYYYAHANQPINTFDPRFSKDVFALFKDFTTVGLTTGGTATSTGTLQTAATITPTNAATGATQSSLASTGAASGNTPNASFGVSTVRVPAEYADQIMPFDVTLIAQNEYGMSAFMVIIGVEVLNEGGGLSVDDITNEEQTTFVARAKTPWIPWVGTAASNDATPGTSTIFPFSSIPQDKLGAFYGSANIPGVTQ